MTETAFGDTFPPFDGTVDTLMRCIVTYLTESTDTPDRTPERLERTLGIALGRRVDGDGTYVTGAGNLTAPWRAIVDFEAAGTHDASFTVDLTPRPAGLATPFPVVQAMDAETTASLLGKAGFAVPERHGAPGRLDGYVIRRGAIRGFLAVQGSSPSAPSRLVIMHLSVRWTPTDAR